MRVLRDSRGRSSSSIPKEPGLDLQRVLDTHWGSGAIQATVKLSPKRIAQLGVLYLPQNASLTSNNMGRPIDKCDCGSCRCHASPQWSTTKGGYL